MTTRTLTGPRGLHYAWVVAAAGFLTLLAAAAFRGAPGLLMIPLEDEFGWSRSTVSAAAAINLVAFGLSAPFAAALVDRIGLRRVVAAALSLIAIASLLSTQADQPWHLYVLWGLVIGCATGAVAPVLAAQIATRWFVERRGMVVGVLTAANSTGQLVFLPVLSQLAGIDWRWVMAAVAFVALLAVPVAVGLMRDRPRDAGTHPLGGEHEPEPPADRPRLSAIGVLREVAPSPTFWILAGTFFICGATTVGLIATHFVPASHDHGISAPTAASLLAAMGVLDIAGTTASGWLTDRFDSRKLLFWYYGLRGLSLIALPFAFAGNHLTLGGFVIFYGLDWIATVPPTVALVAQRFGDERAGTIFGWVFTAHQLGGAAAALLAGVARDAFGDYQAVFIVAGMLCLIAAGLVLRVRAGRTGTAAPVAASPVAAAGIV